MTNNYPELPPGMQVGSMMTDSGRLFLKVYSAEDMRAYVAADRAKRGEPVAWAWKRVSNSSRCVYFENPESIGIDMRSPEYEWTLLYASPPAAPEGWQLVPKEPTPEMEHAGLLAGAYGAYSEREVYLRMLAAAPKEPT
jgi:hypothetical protein